MSLITIEKKGFTDLISGLAAMPHIAKPIAARAMERILSIVRGDLREYPPATEANSPTNPTGRWYERGFGPRWIRKRVYHAGVLPVGTERKQVLKLMRGGAIGGSNTSEVLGKQWYQTVQDIPGGVVGVLGNKASYAGAVQGQEQLPVFKRIGWKTVTAAITEAIPAITAELQSANQKFLERLTKRTR